MLKDMSMKQILEVKDKIEKATEEIKNDYSTEDLFSNVALMLQAIKSKLDEFEKYCEILEMLVHKLGGKTEFEVSNDIIKSIASMEIMKDANSKIMKIVLNYKH